MRFGAKSADVIARRALLDALDVLQPHLDSLILVGAQAVYLHTNHIELPLAPATTDSDIIFDTRSLADFPEIGGLLRRAGFLKNPHSDNQPGHWISSEGVPLDLFQPAALSMRGRRVRGAWIDPHDRNLLRVAPGLDCVLVDNKEMEISSFDTADTRRHFVNVAGPASLLFAKTAKIKDRVSNVDSRLANKDAHDVYRILQAVDTEALVPVVIELLSNELSRFEAEAGFEDFKILFANSQDAAGNIVAARAVGVSEQEQLQASLWALALELVEQVEAGK